MKTEIVNYCSELFDVPARDILSRRRIKPIAQARFALYAALRQRGWSYPRIGMFIGRDHATVIHGVRKAEWLMERYPSYDAKIKALAAWRPRTIVLPPEEIEQ